MSEKFTGLIPTPNAMDVMKPRSREALDRAMEKAGCRNLKDYMEHPEAYQKPAPPALNQLTLFAGDSPASRSVLPGSEKARKMTVTSGLKCLELYKKSGPVGLLAKMLLASSIWGSRIVYLTWKEKVTPSKHLLFQLAPSKPRTEETGCGLLPTVRAGKTTDETEESWTLRQEAGKVSTPPLALAINLLLPTPMVSDIEGAPVKNVEIGNGFSRKNQKGIRHGVKVKDIIAMLPTPATRDYRGANGPEHMTKDRPHLDQLPNAITHGTNRGLKLQPAFVEWMMGFPVDWLDLKDGE